MGKRADDVEGEKEKEPKLDKASKPDEKRREEKRREEKEKDKKDKKDKDKDAPAPMAKLGRRRLLVTSKSLSRTRSRRSSRASRRGTRRGLMTSRARKKKNPNWTRPPSPTRREEKRREEKRKRRTRKTRKTRTKMRQHRWQKLGRLRLLVTSKSLSRTRSRRSARASRRGTRRGLMTSRARKKKN